LYSANFAFATIGILSQVGTTFMPSGKALKGIQRYLAHGMRPTATMWITPVCLSICLSACLAGCLSGWLMRCLAGWLALSFYRIPAYDHPPVFLPVFLHQT
jgi:hypothetical protein